MAIYALIKAGKVDNVIVADAQFIKDNGLTLAADQALDVTNAVPRAGPKWSYDAVAKTFTPPASS
jgi:hypothetical protein